MTLSVDTSLESWLEVELLADESTCLASVVVRDVSWAVGDKIVRCDFHVLDDFVVYVVMSKDYLSDLDIFSTYPELSIDIDSGEADFLSFNSGFIRKSTSGRLGAVLKIYVAEFLHKRARE